MDYNMSDTIFLSYIIFLFILLITVFSFMLSVMYYIADFSVIFL